MPRQLFIAIVLLLLASNQGLAVDLYVAPDGNDAWTGAQLRPNAAKSDGPFATLARARDEIRKQRAAGAVGGGANVWVEEGTYFLPETFELTPADSGTADAPITYAAYKDAKPIISGGTRLTGFQHDAQGHWTLQIPNVQSGSWYFAQLFVNGQRRMRPRLPKNSYYFIAAAAPATPGVRGYDRFHFSEGDISADWHNPSDIDVLVFHAWCMSRLPIAAVDAADHLITLAGGTTNKASWHGLNQGQRYIVENVAEALHDPGEWYLDRKAGALTYIPMPGEDSDKAEVIAPKLETLVRFAGDQEKKQWVSHVNFRGLTFEHTNWVTPPTGWSVNQAEWQLGGAIMASGARDCDFDHCTVSHIGHYAFDLGVACRNDRIENCELTDLGGGGIKIGEQRVRKEDDDLLAGWNTLRHNFIAFGGRLHPAGIGVIVFSSPHNTIEANTIYDFYYTAISAGWTWGYAPSAAHDNAIIGNDLRKIGQNVLSDMGGIYTLGLSDGTVLRGNRMGDIESNTYGGWGIYFDEGSTHILAEDNVVYQTKTGGFHQHYGKENRLVNNIFYSGREEQMKRTRSEEHLAFTFEHNIVAWRAGEGPVLDGKWEGPERNLLDYNLYWQEGSPADWPGPKMGKMTFDQWKQSGEDWHSILADPKFADPARLDFRLQLDSPAARIGFDGAAISAAAAPSPTDPRIVDNFPSAWPLQTPPKPAFPISDDFEEAPVGQPPIGPIVEEDANVKSATIRVTDETAAGGKHSLKFTDAPGQRVPYTPFMYYHPGYTTGLIEGSFDLRVELGARLSHEWRTPGEPYHVGPSITVLPDGSLLAGNPRRKLATVPHGQWLHIAITCPLGDAADGKWDLTLTLPGSEAQSFNDLPCDPAFKSLDWYGFSSEATEKTAFYLDNLALKPGR